VTGPTAAPYAVVQDARMRLGHYVKTLEPMFTLDQPDFPSEILTAAIATSLREGEAVWVTGEAIDALAKAEPVEVPEEFPRFGIALYEKPVILPVPKDHSLWSAGLAWASGEEIGVFVTIAHGDPSKLLPVRDDGLRISIAHGDPAERLLKLKKAHPAEYSGLHWDAVGVFRNDGRMPALYAAIWNEITTGVARPTPHQTSRSLERLRYEDHGVYVLDEVSS